MEANFLLLLFLTCGILYLYPIMGKPSQYKIRIISILLVGFAIYLVC